MNMTQANFYQSQGIKPYECFSFLQYPARWLLVFLCWNLGCALIAIGNFIQRNVASLMVIFFLFYVYALVIVSRFIVEVLSVLIP